VFDRIEQIGLYNRVAKFTEFCRIFAFFGPQTAFQRASNAATLYINEILEKNWKRFGRFWGKSGPIWVKNRQSLNYDRIVRVFRI
jgi:hypothetical protein